MGRQKLINLHNAGSNAKPKAADMEFGEIAVNHAPGNEKLWIKSGSDMVTDFCRSKLPISPRITTKEAMDDFIEGGYMKYANFSVTGSNTGLSGDDGMILSIPWTSTGYGAQIAFEDDVNTAISVRSRKNQNAWTEWKKLAFKTDIPSIPDITINDTGSGNAVTDVTASGHILTLTRGKNFSEVGHTHDRILNGSYGAKITSNGYFMPVAGNEHIGMQNDPWDKAYISEIVGNLTGKATKAGYADSAGTANSLREANLEWGGKNFNARFGVIDASMIPELGANRLAFAKPEGVVIEYSNDGGSTWKDYGADSYSKKALTSDGAGFKIGKYSTNPSTAKDKLRITFKTGEAGVYTALNKFAIYISTEGGSGCTCTIQKALQSTPENYTTVVDKQSIGGWSGWNIINVSPITTYGNTADSQYGRIRFIFESNGGGSQYKGLIVYKLYGFGGMGWSTPSNMAKNGHLYSYNANQRAFFPEYVSASGFIKSGYDDSYVLLGGGGSEAKSSITVGKSNSLVVKSVTDLDSFNNGSTLQCGRFSGKVIPGIISNDGMIISVPWSSTTYGYQIALDDQSQGMAVRARNTEGWTEWSKVILDNSTIDCGTFVPQP